MIGWVGGCGLCPWRFSGKVGAYEVYTSDNKGEAKKQMTEEMWQFEELRTMLHVTCITQTPVSTPVFSCTFPCVHQVSG